MIKIKNIDRAVYKQQESGVWLQYWINSSKRKPKVCAAKSCINTDIVGALVKKAEAGDNNIYVVPLCRFHSTKEGVVELITGTRLITLDN